MSASVDSLAQPKLRFAWLWWAMGWLLIVATITESLKPKVLLQGVARDKVLHFLGAIFGFVGRPVSRVFDHGLDAVNRSYQFVLPRDAVAGFPHE